MDEKGKNQSLQPSQLDVLGRVTALSLPPEAGAARKRGGSNSG